MDASGLRDEILIRFHLARYSSGLPPFTKEHARGACTTQTIAWMWEFFTVYTSTLEIIISFHSEESRSSQNRTRVCTICNTQYAKRLFAHIKSIEPTHRMSGEHSLLQHPFRIGSRASLLLLLCCYCDKRGSSESPSSLSWHVGCPGHTSRLTEFHFITFTGLWEHHQQHNFIRVLCVGCAPCHESTLDDEFGFCEFFRRAIFKRSFDILAS